MPIMVKKTDRMLIVDFRNKMPENLRLVNYECPVDVDDSGEIIGLEVEAPCHSFYSQERRQAPQDSPQ